MFFSQENTRPVSFERKMQLARSAPYRRMYVAVIGLQLVAYCFGAIGNEKSNKPNILFILADDLGWNDVDWHDPTLYSPNLNSLANGPHSVQLDAAYVNQLCSPYIFLPSSETQYHIAALLNLFQSLVQIVYLLMHTCQLH